MVGYGNNVGEYSFSGQTNNAALATYTWSPSAMTFDPAGNLYVSYLSGLKVLKYSPSGATLSSGFPTDNGFWPLGIVWANNNIYVANDYDGSVGLYSTSGGTMNRSLVTGLGSQNLRLASDGMGHLFVSEYGNGVIAEYTTAGAMVNANLITGLDSPEGIAVDAKGDLFVSISDQGRIAEYSTSGTLINANFITGAGFPTDVAVDGSGNLYVTGIFSGAVAEYNAAGVLVNADLITTPLGITSVEIVPEPKTTILALLGTVFLAFRSSRRCKPSPGHSA